MALFSSTQPSIRARVLARFPANVVGGNGITITKSGTTYTFAWTPGTLIDAVDDAAAAVAGVAVGDTYRNGSVLMVRVA